jgi:aspartate carbamoyltransferase catalytic subunit
MNAARADRLPKHAFIMHPGPMNRGIEISSDIADAQRTLVLQQVNAGVAVRMAILYLLLGGESGGASA